MIKAIAIGNYILKIKKYIYFIWNIFNCDNFIITILQN